MRKVGTNLGGAIANFERARYSRRQQRAQQLELDLKEVMHPADAARLAAEFASLVAPPGRKEEPFIMMQPAQNAAVVRWLRQHSKRPQAATALWAELFTVVHPSTHEILLSREELAERVGVEPRNISSMMTELVKINAIMRRKEGRRVIYSMNPNVGTHIPTPEARSAARTEAGPLLVLMEGGKGKEAHA